MKKICFLLGLLCVSSTAFMPTPPGGEVVLLVAEAVDEEVDEIFPLRRAVGIFDTRPNLVTPGGDED